MEKLPFRQIHLDFHTNGTIENIAGKFDPEEFADTLKAAHVNSVSVFARCHHGMMYYDSKRNPERIHPNLSNKNLLKDQVEACHKKGIRTPIYTTVQWDYYTSQRHREWLCMDENGRSFGEGGNVQLPFEAGFYEILCLNTPYRQFLKDHVEELLEMFHPADEIFFDIVTPVPCACPACRKLMHEQGYNPLIQSQRQEFYEKTLRLWQREMTALVLSSSENATVFYNRGHVGTVQRESQDTYTHFELESLPSGIWGYLHFPSTVRYARTLGKEYLAQTGKFHTMWGDFYSYKNQAALEFECFHMLAMGSKCLIGDQLNPDGRLSEAVYDLVGKVYSQVEEKEPWCAEVTPAVEIGVFTSEEFSSAGSAVIPKTLQGAVRILQESALQFDVLDTKSGLEKYKLLILPDEIPVNEMFGEKLKDYFRHGGKAIFTCKSGLAPDGSGFALDIGVIKQQEQPVDIYGDDVVARICDRGDYCQYILPGRDIGGGLPKDYHVMYTRGVNIAAAQGAETLVEAYSSVFDRDYRHFCSHRQSPCSGDVAQPAVVRSGGVIYFSHPVFAQYQYNAPLWCKKMMQDAIHMLLSDVIISHDGPSTVITAVNDQPGLNRRIVHLLHYIPERRCESIDIIEDVIPIYQITCKVEAVKKIAGVICQPQNVSLPFKEEAEKVSFTVPKVEGHQIIEIAYE